MDLNKFTHKSQEALQAAAEMAKAKGHAEVDTEHVLLSLMHQSEGLVKPLLEQAGNTDSNPRIGSRGLVGKTSYGRG